MGVLCFSDVTSLPTDVYKSLCHIATPTFSGEGVGAGEWFLGDRRKILDTFCQSISLLSQYIYIYIYMYDIIAGGIVFGVTLTRVNNSNRNSLRE